ncbi:EamA family transporter [Longibacter salinarum]|uniref:EamA family transporter n=1 Tax=Longibacter salinarum TaxID=1850348 RepID=A0A2A8CUK1_9BACT|nr:EamA family transporter [Longibacter salinarum]PEN12286.1 EamA family transporter [Longibacter salinarum]
MTSSRFSGYLLTLTAATCWGLLGPMARVALADGVSALEVAFWRATVGGALFALHVALLAARRSARPSPARRRLRLQRADIPAVIGFGVIGVALFYGSYQLAVESGGAALASVLLYTAPAWVAGMGAAFLSEPLTRHKVGAVALTLAGVTAIAMGGTAGVTLTTVGILWGLLSGFLYASYYPFGKHYFQRYVPAAIFAVALPIGAIVLLPWIDFAPKSSAAWLALTAIAFISTYGAYLAYGAALQRLAASRASIVATLEPVVAAVVATLWWNEDLGVWGYVGAAMIVVATLLAAMERERTPTPPADSITENVA